MKLKQRLFFLVSILFVIAFVLSSFLENYLTKHYLIKSEKNIRREIFKINEVRRQDYEEFLTNLLTKIEAQINALLKAFTQDLKPFEKGGDWQNLAFLLLKNKWLDFLQYSTSGIMLNIPPINASHAISLTEDLALFFVQDDSGKWKGPYMGIKLGLEFAFPLWVLFDMQLKTQGIFANEIDASFYPPFFLLNALGDLKNKILNQYVSAQNFLKEHPEIWKAPKDLSIQKPDLSSYEKFEELDEDRFKEIEMIFSSLMLFSPIGQGPVGMSFLKPGETLGKAILNEDVFISKSLSGTCAAKPLCSAKGLSIISVPEKKRVFFTNTLNEGGHFLTIGIDERKILKELALATHRHTVFISEGKVIDAYSPTGQELNDPNWTAIPVNEILSRSSGEITIGSTLYFYLHISPKRNADFHFFLFTPDEQEFALVDTLNKNAAKAIKRISIHMRLAAIGALLIVLLFLNRIAKKIAGPITLLANATKEVEKGHYDQIHLPTLKKQKKDEVSILYHSFSEMVNGLKEKEKVRGVLNKVVSSEIAEEILKGTVHLGGEEKKVTVLFADIRGFTHLTEKMPPGKVIELLNNCMTKIARPIDEHGGVIDKYVGDEVMALFGAPLSAEDSAFKAIQCAIEMIKILNEWNKERKNQSLPPIEMGIGIHTGIVVAGNMGAEDRLNYTVLGANVNLASRLCDIAEPMQILVTQDTIDDPSVKGKFKAEPVSEFSLKGFEEKIKVYKIIL